MRVAVMGAGAVGGYFGGRLAKAGHEVCFIARGSHLRAIQENGLKIESALGDLHLRNVVATDDPKTIGPVDCVLFSVKLWDTETAGKAARALVEPETRVINLQNGIDGVERLTPILGNGIVAAGPTRITAVIVAPGIIHHTGANANIVCGPHGGLSDQRLGSLIEQMKLAHVEIKFTDAIELERWKKFVLLMGYSGISAMTRKSMGAILNDVDARTLFIKLMDEAVTVGIAKGIPLESDFTEQQIQHCCKRVSPNAKASMLEDLERGRRLELDWMQGKIVELGRTMGIAVPAHENVYAALMPYRMGCSPCANAV